MDPRWPVQVFYDASCRLCAAEMHNLRLRDQHGRLHFVDCSSADYTGGPAPRAELMQALHCQDAAGRVFVGVDAFQLLYRTVGLHQVQTMLANPLIGGLSRRLYPVVARYRQRLPAWLIAPLFERAARKAAQAAAQRSQTCAQGWCELPERDAPAAADMASSTDNPSNSQAAEKAQARPAPSATAATLAADPSAPMPHAQPPATPASPGAASATGAPPSGKVFLLTGANGFIGRHIAAELRARGHRVLAASRHSTPPCDFAHMTRASDWQDWLIDPVTGQPVDGAINAVGALRDRPGRSLQALHANAPMALFDACAQSGVRRVVQVSALGIANGDTAYARTKRQAQCHLLALTEAGRLDGLVLQPSVVFGHGGASSALFTTLARLPVLPLPRAAREQPIQPIHVNELAEAIVNLALSDATGMQALGGSRALTMAEFIASLRTQLKQRPAWQITQPNWLTHTTARLGDAVPVSPWCSASWDLMRTPTAFDPAVLQAALGRPPTPPEALLRISQQ